MNNFVNSLREEFNPDREDGITDPEAWLKHRLDGFAWSKQLEILRALDEHSRVAVPSCHGAGKSQLAAWAVTRFIDIHEPGTAMVVSTAPRAHQVRSVLWRYIRRIHSQGKLPGKITQGQIPEWTIDGDLVAFGRKPADMDASSWQGIHELNLLIVFDEACGIREEMFTAAESLMTSDNCKWLCIGNPDDRSSFFAKVCQTEPGWRVIPISAYETPNLSGEEVPDYVAKRLVKESWVRDKETRWGLTNPLFVSKVLGQFADAEDGLVPLSWANAAVSRWHDYMESKGVDAPTGRTIVAADPAWLGSDESAVIVRKGSVVLSATTYGKLDTGQLASILHAEMRKWVTPVAIIDTAGIGAGVYDQLKDYGHHVIPFNGAASTSRRDKSGTWSFPNCRSAAWHGIREALDPQYGATLAIPDNDQLIADICAPKYGPTAGAKLLVEPKDKVKQRIHRSPDLGDCLSYSLWVDPPGSSKATDNVRLAPLNYAVYRDVDDWARADPSAPEPEDYSWVPYPTPGSGTYIAGASRTWDGEGWKPSRFYG